MNGKPRRRRSYVASQRPDFNESAEKWCDFFKVDKNDADRKLGVAMWLEAMRRKRSASDK